MHDANNLKGLAFEAEDLISVIDSEIEIKFDDDRRGKARLTTITDDTSDDFTYVTVKVKYGGLECIGISKIGDYFSALKDARICIEKTGVLLCCYGASLNVHPVPGITPSAAAYKLTHKKPVSLLDRVSIFNSGPDIIPATVEDQKEYYGNWVDSLYKHVSPEA